MINLHLNTHQLLYRAHLSSKRLHHVLPSELPCFFVVHFYQAVGNIPQHFAPYWHESITELLQMCLHNHGLVKRWRIFVPLLGHRKWRTDVLFYNFWEVLLRFFWSSCIDAVNWISLLALWTEETRSWRHFWQSPALRSSVVLSFRVLEDCLEEPWMPC